MGCSVRMNSPRGYAGLSGVRITGIYPFHRRSLDHALGRDGFLAAFAAGFAGAVLNFELYDCFLDYGETTTEMAMHFSFILFGAVISDIAFDGGLVTLCTSSSGGVARPYSRSFRALLTEATTDLQLVLV